MADPYVINMETGEAGYVPFTAEERKQHTAAQKAARDSVAEADSGTLEQRIGDAIAAALKAAVPDATAKQIEAAGKAARKALAG